MMCRRLGLAGILISAILQCYPAGAATIVLDGVGLNGQVNESPTDYYNGGYGGSGSGPGPSYGITFSSNTITGAAQPGGNTNSAMLPVPGNLFFFLSGGTSTMDVLGGFTTGFSFYYSAPIYSGAINVWSGLDDTGTLLATLTLPTTTNGTGVDGCLNEPYCPFVPIGVSFSGTAHSVDFSGTDNYIGFDAITLGSASPNVSAVPLPSTWGMMVIGLACLGFVGFRQKSQPALRAAA